MKDPSTTGWSLSPASVRIVAFVLLLWAVGCSGPTAPATADEFGDPPADGASVRELQSDPALLHVDGSPDGPATKPDGSVDRPYPSIASAVERAQSLREDGQAVRVVVAPGVYREQVTIGSVGDDPSLALVSKVPGEAVVSGADVEDRWTPVPGTERFWAPWDEDWGLSPVPRGWEGVHVSDGVRRREAVVVDGAPLRQVLTEGELAAGTFRVDEEGDRIIVEPPAAVDDLRDHVVEVARRGRVLHVQGGAQRVTVRGFVFEAGAAPLDRHMAYVSDATDVRIEGNTFRHSSWGGLGICCTSGITVRDNTAVENGGNGIDTYRADDALIEGNTIIGNNVRGIRHGFTGWSVAGSKHLLLHGAVLRDNVYRNNSSRGLWFDTDVKNVLVDGDRSCANLRDGVFIEAVQGPLMIRDSLFCDNLGGGVLVGTSGGVSLEHTTMASNGWGQLIFSGDRNRTWADHATGETIEMGDFEDWTLVDNTFRSREETPLISAPVIPMEQWTDRLAAGEILARDNTWLQHAPGGAIEVQGTNFPMDSWAALTSPTDGSEVGDRHGPPVATITDGPVGTVSTDTSRFSFRAGREDVTFQCRLDGDLWDACTSPRELDGLAPGEHTFVVRAVDEAGDHGPAVGRIFTVAAEDVTVCEEDSSATHPFSDVGPGHVFCSEIAWMAEEGVTEGYGDGTFRPDGQVTRQAMSAFMARLVGAEPAPCASAPFVDVPASHMFCSEIAWMAEEGVTEGYGDGTFRPDGQVARQAMSAFMARLSGPDATDG